MSESACLFFLFHLRFIEVKCGFCVKLNLTHSWILFLHGSYVSLSIYIFVPLVLSSFCLTWGCRGHVRLSCGWPLVDRSSGASSRRQRRIYYRLTWSYLHCCCSPMAPSISSFCSQGQSERRRGENTASATEKSRITAAQIWRGLTIYYQVKDTNSD